MSTDPGPSAHRWRALQRVNICRSCSIVHDPPPAFEDRTRIDRLPSLAEHYAASAASEPDDGSEDFDLFGRMAAAGLIDLAEEDQRRIRELMQQVANLERELAALREHAASVERRRDELERALAHGWAEPLV
jgi:hypothetical protein